MKIAFFLVTALVMATILFLDVIIEKGGNFAANKIQDEFQVKISKVNIKPLSLKTSMSLNVADKKSRETIVTSEELAFDVNFKGIVPYLDLRLNETSVTVTKDLILSLSQERKNEQEKEKKSTDVISYLGSIEVRDLGLSFSDKDETLFTHLLALDLNFPEGKGSIKGIRAVLPKENIRLFNVENIELDFNSDGILGDESAKLAVTVNQAEGRLASKAIEELKELFKFPKKREENGTSPLKELSSIELNDTRITDIDRNLAAFTGFVEVDFEQGHSVISDVRADWTHTGRKLVSLNKMSSSFSPEALMSGESMELALIVTDLRLVVGKELQSLLKQAPKREADTPKDLPFSISRILIGSSSVSFPEVPGVGKQKHLSIKDIFGNIYDLTLKAGTPLAKFNFNATFEGKTKLMADGQLDLAHSPPQASVEYRLFDFDMRKINPELREKIPVTFQDGEFHLMGEVIKRNKDIVGYFKPFLADASYLGNDKEFKNSRHFVVEIGATIANWLLENSETKTVSTNVPFVIRNGSIDFKTGEAMWNAVEHGLLESKQVKPEADKYELRQAQEEP